MTGLYVHIPFCKKRCLYCDFFSTTLLARRKEYVEAVLAEIAARKHEADTIRTIYLGGGTPSMLEAADIARILQAIGLSNAEEITMEMNPGDVNPSYLQAIRDAGIDRLSIGIQSFQDPLLRLIGRRHDAQQALTAVKMAQKAGFDNLSVDLMYALPTQTMDQWHADIETALRLGIQHISSYGLMYEEGTALTQQLEAGTIEPIDEDTENAMYDILCERLKEAGFVHYEVSNFALPGFEAKHNSRYWDHTPYIGIGAGAHSLIGRTRSWNPSDLDTYISGIKNGTLQRESEHLTDRDWYNEQIMLGLRTCRGYNGPMSDQCRTNYERLSRSGLLAQTSDGHVVATQQGIHVLNRIIEELMI